MKKLALVVLVALAAPAIACPNHDEATSTKTAQKPDGKDAKDAKKPETSTTAKTAPAPAAKPADPNKPDKVSSR
jgi:hypothetical protein